jgi:hypothetical protein
MIDFASAGTKRKFAIVNEGGELLCPVCGYHQNHFFGIEPDGAGVRIDVQCEYEGHCWNLLVWEHKGCVYLDSRPDTLRDRVESTARELRWADGDGDYDPGDVASTVLNRLEWKLKGGGSDPLYYAHSLVHAHLAKLARACDPGEPWVKRKAKATPESAEVMAQAEGKGDVA